MVITLSLRSNNWLRDLIEAHCYASLPLMGDDWLGVTTLVLHDARRGTATFGFPTRQWLILVSACDDL